MQKRLQRCGLIFGLALIAACGSATSTPIDKTPFRSGLFSVSAESNSLSILTSSAASIALEGPSDGASCPRGTMVYIPENGASLGFVVNIDDPNRTGATVPGTPNGTYAVNATLTKYKSDCTVDDAFDAINANAVITVSQYVAGSTVQIDYNIALPSGVDLTGTFTAQSTGSCNAFGSTCESAR